MPDDSPTLGMASRLWTELMSAGEHATDDRSSAVAGGLRRALRLPEPSAAEKAVTVPAGDSGQVLIFDPDGDLYLVKAAIQFEPESQPKELKPPVVIDTREGALVLDADDPLARAQMGVRRLRDL